MKEERKAQEQRLKEIQSMTFAGLSDDAILEVLAERKHLENIILEYQRQDALAQESLQKHESLLKEEKEIEAKITHLNKEIRPDKKDEELLELIQERKVLEDELLHIEQELHEPLPGQKLETTKIELKPVVSEEKTLTPEISVGSQASETRPVTKRAPEPSKTIFKEAGFGDQGIRLDGLQESGDFEKYVHQLEASHDSLGNFLQSLPREARKNKSFMLRVASIDPAYAMHYAVDELRLDEDFHIRVAGIKNSRGSGNALAEMDPAMRTGQVVLVGTREDFRNVHFVREDMPEYDEIIKTAKKSALETISKFKEAVDLRKFIPKVLQSDEDFMAKVEVVLQRNQKS